MPIRNASPLGFIATGLSDSLDQSTSFAGACSQLSDLIFDRVNRLGLVPRPGVGTPITSFAGFSVPTAVTCAIAVGSRIYGMVSTSRNAGMDEPFCYDTSTSAFVTISGVLSTNVPTSPATSGAWTPPTMAVISTKIIVTHPGFTGSGANFVGVIDISTPASPAWSSSDLTTNAFPSVPTWVAQFFNRAYYGCGNVVVFSDVLVPLTRTNSTQSLTLGDTNVTIAAAGLPVSTGTQGILQALIVFKGVGNGIWQITGDQATGNLVLNQLSGSNGTNAPRSVVAVPTGIAFMDSDGVRTVSLLGQIGYLNSDIVQPFLGATTPSRAAAVYANSVYRLCLDTTIAGTLLSKADFWFDFLYQRWNGWHSFGYDCAIEIGGVCYLSSTGEGAKIFASKVVPDGNSIYTDNSNGYTGVMQSAYLPVEKTMNMKSVIESTVEIVSGQGPQYTVNVSMVDEDGNECGSASVNSQPAASAWGTGVWGSFQWTISSQVATPVAINWSSPVVFSIANIRATVIAAKGVGIKEWWLRVQQLNRMVANA